MIRIAMEAAREGGAVLRRFLGKVRHIETKHNEQSNLVTEADKASEEAIVNLIRRHYPKHAILAEEGGASGDAHGTRWIIDPLDGTTNFTHAFPMFSVSIGVERDGVIVAGVVYDPVRDEMFHAERGGGAFLNGRPIRVSLVDTLDKAMLVTGFPYNVRQNPNYCHERFIAFLMHAQAVRRLGSAALDCAYVAAGRLDGFWEVALQPWDKAAGALLVTEAGGTISNFEGGVHDLFDPPFLGSNGRIHAQMVDVLARARSLTISMDRTAQM